MPTLKKYLVACSLLAFGSVGVANAAFLTIIGATGAPDFTVTGPAKSARDLFLVGLSSNNLSPVTETIGGLTSYTPTPVFGNEVPDPLLVVPGTLGLFGGGATLRTGSLDGQNYDVIVAPDSLNDFPFSRTLGRWDTTTSPDNLGTVNDPIEPTGKFLETRSKFAIEFTQAISAFGVFIVDMGDFASEVKACLSKDGLDPYCENPNVGVDSLWNVDSNPNGAKLDGNLFFWGFIDDAATYKSVAFLNIPGSCIRQNGDTRPACTSEEQGNLDGIGFDDLIIGRAVTNPAPEPGTLALIGMGLLAAGRMRRRSI